MFLYKTKKKKKDYISNVLIKILPKMKTFNGCYLEYKKESENLL